MSDKQDRVAVRTPADLERKYQFGKTFAEMLGLINDARDKVDSVSSTVGEITEQATSLSRTTEEIVAEATETKKTLSDAISDVSNDVNELTKTVNLKLNADGLNLEIQKELQKGVDRIETKTGYSFGADGLNISKSGEEMANKLDNTGMYVTKSGEEILTANNKGVGAVNLHAKTYLIVGAGDGRSRFEDYGTNRTGCFWVGD